MIALPKFPDEPWYLKFVEENAIDKRLINEERKKEELLKYEEILQQVISKEDFNEDKQKYTLFQSLIIASYSELERIKEKLESCAEIEFFETKIVEGKEKRTLKDEWKKIYNLYDKLIRNDMNIELVERYGIKCCPYCNQNYIFNRKKKKGKSYSMAQLDHYYARDKFPIFAVSLYNLIPSCSTCNHIKSANEIGVSPHNRKYDFSQMHISYSPTNADYLNNTDSFKIEFSYDDNESEFKKKLENNLNEMGIKESYEMHKDYVVEILKKAQIYDKSHRINIMNDLPELFSSDDELIQTIFANYIKEEDLLKRPLSKLTRDLLKEMEIIG